MQLIDLTHTFTDDMPVFPGDPAASLKLIAIIETAGYNNHELHCCTHVGTHMDAPLHMIAGGKYMNEITLEAFLGTGVLLDARGLTSIDESLFEGKTVKPGSIVLLYTGFGEKYKTPAYFENYPNVTEDFAKRAVDLEVKMVGMDMLGPDQPPYPTHKILLSNGVLIVENLTNLASLLHVPAFDIIALPMKLHADAAPVRVIAVVK